MNNKHKMIFLKRDIFSFVLFLLWGIATVYAQKKDTVLPKANEQYSENNFVEAEASYRISNSKFNNKSVANYNLGNSIYKQNQPSEAKYAFAKAIESTKSKSQKHKAFHNLGNVFMKEKDYTQAVEAYKNALRNNPSDEESRYNLALAKKMLKENPPKNDDKNKNKDKDKDKDKNKDKDKKDGDKDKNKDKKDDPNKDKKDDKKDGNKDKKDPKKGDNPDQGQPKPMPGGISKQRLENLLDAVNNEEKKIQGKVNANKVKGRPVDTDKDW